MPSLGRPQLLGHLLIETDFSAFLDLYLAVYPSIVLYKLQMTRKKKIALCGALGIGSMYVPPTQSGLVEATMVLTQPLVPPSSRCTKQPDYPH